MVSELMITHHEFPESNNNEQLIKTNQECFILWPMIYIVSFYTISLLFIYSGMNIIVNHNVLMTPRLGFRVIHFCATFNKLVRKILYIPIGN